MVQTANGNKITVAETIFYAFSGGQESDSGTIGGYKVLEAKKDGKEIFYTLGENHRLKTGDIVKMCIDWNRRYKLMRLHFAAQEIISAFSDETNERRYWKINEFSEVPCGGTHIKRTGEMGIIRLKRANPGKGRERIEIYVSEGQ